jgi:hypothetical protein
MKDTNIFSFHKLYYHLFKTTEKKLKLLFEDDEKDKDELLRRKTGYINTVLNNFGISIESFRVRDGGKEKTNIYKLNLHNINEIIMNKMKRGFVLKDNDNIFKKPETLIYRHLINDEVENKNEIKTNNLEQVDINIDTSDTNIEACCPDNLELNYNNIIIVNKNKVNNWVNFSTMLKNLPIKVRVEREAARLVEEDKIILSKFKNAFSIKYEPENVYKNKVEHFERDETRQLEIDDNSTTTPDDSKTDDGLSEIDKSPIHEPVRTTWLSLFDD